MPPAFRLPVVLLALALGSSGSAAPADDDVRLEFSRLDLTDGRRLKNVAVKTYDPASQKLLLIADGKAMTVPISLLPPPLHEQLKSAPRSGGSVSVVGLSARSESTPPSDASADRSAASPTERPPPVAQPRTPAPPIREPAPPREPARQRTSNELLAAQTRADLDAHKAAALARAERYYRFEFRLGTEAGAVTGLDLETTSPKPISGWEGRYRTGGKAYLEVYDSRGRSFQRRTSTFEVITEKRIGDDDLVVIDFTAKS